jgi:hypothetical protein
MISMCVRTEERSFQNLLSLKELHLEVNLIKSINERAFHRIPSIRLHSGNSTLLELSQCRRIRVLGIEPL